MDSLWLVFPGLVIWSSILLLPWRLWSTRETLDAGEELHADLSDVTILIPARNEEEFIGATLEGAYKQGVGHKIILIDDQSTDCTVAVAENKNIQSLNILSGIALEPGWSGKLWALEQGLSHVTTKNILLLGADIHLAPGTVNALLLKMKRENLQLVSLMAFLRMESIWEKLLIPAFIYFFKLLYPFHVSNSKSKLVAAAAGGCILMGKMALEEVGGFASIKNELIDDCALARQFKSKGNLTWIGLTHSAISQQKYGTLRTIWEMATRTAFTQLKYSFSLLVICTLLMFSAFIAPIVTLFSQNAMTVTFSSICLLLMMVSYLPTLKYYGFSVFWSFTLPIIGLFYLIMTWGSAIGHWQGAGAIWKERAYTK